MSNNNGQKDTVYIDVDDEITAVIDKLRGSPHKIVALVLPKRAAVFQSTVNMKLLKRTAESTKKKIVLITSEAALLPLAGAAGLHVAKTLQSKPEIPPVPSAQGAGEGDKQLDPGAAVGDLADNKDGDEESADVDDNKDTKTKDTSGKKKSKIKVPNFEKFRLRIILGGLALVVLVVGFVLGWIVLPKASITITTDTSTVDANFSFIADTKAQAPDEENSVLPAISKEFRRTDTEQVDASGEKNKGKKASGSIVMTNCSETDGSVTIPEGTGVSTGDLTFVTDKSITLPPSAFSGGSGQCITPSETISATADQPGEKYNISSGEDFSVAGYPGVEATNNSAMKGGTDDIVKIVSQADIDKGRKAIQDRANNTAAEDLREDLQDENYFPIQGTLVASEPTITTDRKAGDEADSVTITSTTVNTMLGVKREDLARLIDAEVSNEIDADKQTVSDNGLSDAKFGVESREDSRTTINVAALVTIGPDLDSSEIKKQVAGKKRNQTEEIVREWPDIADVQVEYSPFWVSSTPNNTSKITIRFEESK